MQTKQKKLETTAAPNYTGDRIVREPERKHITGVPTSTWYPLMDQGKAPKPVHIGVRSVGWHLSKLNKWVEDPGAWQELGDVADRVIKKVAP